MADTVETLTAQRDTLLRAMRSGVSTIQHGDKTVKYRSLEDIMAAVNDIDAEIAVLNGKPRRRIRHFRIHKAL